MTTKRYPLWDEAIIQGSANSSLTGSIRAILIHAANYTYSDLHQYLSDVPVLARVATSTPLANKTYTGGALDADDVTFLGVTGLSVQDIVLYIDTGAEATSRLLGFIDNFSSGMPIAPNGNNIIVSWSNGADKILRLGA